MNTAQITALMFSSILSVLIFWIFKEMGRRNEKALPVIVMNYLVCMILGNIILGETHLLRPSTLTKEGVWPIFFLGFLFMVTFLLMAESTRESGASLSAVASKMSMVIPVSSAMVFFNEAISSHEAILTKNQGVIAQTSMCLRPIYWMNPRYIGGLQVLFRGLITEIIPRVKLLNGIIGV